MKKVAIVTITDNNNFGNRLQNYAVEQLLIKNNMQPFTIWQKEELKEKIKEIIKEIMFFNKIADRFKKFKSFTNKYTNKFYVKNYDNITDSNCNFDYYLIGSDQIWNFKWQLNRNRFLLNIPKNKIFSFAASFGVSKIEEKYCDWYKKILNNVEKISVREDAGKKIVEDVVGRKDVQVLVDPTMLLTAEEWDKVAKKPEQLKTDRYILNYFLGELSEKRKAEIDRIAKENNCEIINILDKNSPFYCTGPSEFLYLEKNAKVICTDSFHSCVFAILFNRPFIIFSREDKKENNMNSRIETLINKFNLKNREYNEKEITKENLNHDYTEAYKILDEERKKSIKFLRQALDLEGENND